MKYLFHWLCIALMLAVVCIKPAWAGLDITSDAQLIPGRSFTYYYSEGEVAVGSSNTIQLTLHNSGSSAITLTGITFTNSANYSVTHKCMSGSTGTLAGSASCTINVKFAPQATGSQNSDISVCYDQTCIVTHVTGTAAPPPQDSPVVNISPTTVTFGQVNIGATSSKVTVVVSNGSSSALTLGTFMGSNSAFSAKTTCISGGSGTLAPGASCTIDFTFLPQTTGTQSGSLSFYGGSQAYSISLSGTGVAVAPSLISLSVSCPTSLSVGKTGNCTATAGYSDGSNKGVTPSWSSSNAAALAVGASGGLLAGTVSASTSVAITASYSDGGSAKTASQNVSVVAPTSPPCASSVATIDDSGSITSRTVSGHLTLDCNDIGKNGSIYAIAKLPAEIGGGWFFMDDAGAWRSFDLSANPAPYRSEALMSRYDVPLVTKYNLSSLIGTDVWIGYATTGSWRNMIGGDSAYTIKSANTSPTPTPTPSIDPRVVGTWTLYSYTASQSCITYLYISCVNSANLESSGLAVIGSDGSAKFKNYGGSSWFGDTMLTPYSGHAGAYGVIPGLTAGSKFYLYYNDSNGTLVIMPDNGDKWFEVIGVKK